MDTKNDIKIVLTGGHAATPGIATVRELRKRNFGKELQIYWVGSKKSAEGSKISTLEYKIYPEIGVKFYPITAGKIQTKFTRHTIPSLLKIPVGFVQAFIALLKIKPKVVLSFGGYASFPVVFWAWVFRIPVFLHEQTVAAGRASMASSFFATWVAVSREESLKFFPKSKVTVTGNPVMPEIVKVEPKTTLGNPPTILIMGGSRGSQFINEEVANIADKLTQKYKLIHITGEANYLNYKNFESSRYEVLSMVDPRNIYKYYEKADIIISRAGASSVSEIMIVKRPAILIPLPRTFMDEQVKNAKYAEDFGIAKVMLEKEVNSVSLESIIDDTFENWKRITQKVKDKKSPDKSAAKNLVDLVSPYLK